MNLVQIKVSEWAPWLKSQPWFIPGEERLAENFPLVVRHLLHPAEFRREVILELTQPTNAVSAGYHAVAELMMKGLLKTVLTTNFDKCLPMAFAARHPHLRRVAEANRGPGDFAEFNPNNPRQLIWLHGCAEQYSDRNLPEEIEHLAPALLSNLRPMLDHAPVVVIGYRGAEPSIMDDLFGGGVASSMKYRHGVYWCVRGREPLHPNVERLREGIGSNFHRIEIDGFDELMTGLATALKEEDAYPSRGASASPSPAFDETPMPEVAFEDLDADLMLATLATYCDTVGRTPATRDNLRPLLRELGLVHPDATGAEVPTVGCVLLFARELPEALAHAKTAVTVVGKGKRLFEGNLIAQHRELLEVLDGPDLNPNLKVKGTKSYTAKRAYPTRPLTELVVNLIVHRDYAVHELAVIDVQPGRQICFSNPGTLAPDLRDRVKPDADGRFKPVRTATHLSNPSLADVFFGMRKMEREGTGLADVEEEMVRGGGDAEFGVDQREGSFRAVLRQPLQAAPGVTAAARPLAALGVYVLNALPVAVLPERVSVCTLRPGMGRDLFKEAGVELPVLVLRGEEIWSFAPAALLAVKLRHKLLPNSMREIERREIEADPDQRRVLSWLLRKHWEMHLRRFRNAGLFIERKKSRAFFRKGEQRAVIMYDSPKRKGIRREVVKERADGRWHENEGIGYEIAWTDGHWAIRIKPFYMFTRRDGSTPLPSFERTRRATRRVKFDRNKNVDDDLTFWSRWLSEGRDTISIGGTDVDDLVVRSSFLVVEVPEIGLLNQVTDGRPDRVSA